MEFTVVQGDIAAERADALRRGASGPMNEGAMGKGPVDLGEVAVTDAYDLDAEYVIHAAAMPHYGDGRATTDSIRRTTRDSLEKADELGRDSIVVPILGTGAAGFGFEDGARLVGEKVWQHETTNLTDARVVAYSQREYETLERVAEEVRTTPE